MLIRLSLKNLRGAGASARGELGAVSAEIVQSDDGAQPGMETGGQAPTIAHDDAAPGHCPPGDIVSACVGIRHLKKALPLKDP
ncbi:hypothetical protein LC092_11335 [Stappia stellulata]|uniref:hypothetical protein n=1 Tax=Stappia stellulata TaxID=71235 RepID=UPI001CD5B56C|nr:hypothetical protein [Stappia stellulata]MCA1243031.1 hypothetical protein [Stappia stellulata]